MNRIAIMLNAAGEFSGVCSDEPVAVFIVDPNAKREPVYHFGSTQVGHEHVDRATAGFVGHPAGHSFGIAGGSAPPPKPEKPKPGLRVVTPDFDGAA
jgi:hypothetical protein